MTSALGYPATLGPYALEEPIGKGAMGVVHRATDTRSGRRLAVKLLPPHTAADDGARRSLLREARKAALLQGCPFVVRIVEAGVVDDRAFLAMELVEGVPVVQWLAAQPPAERGPHALRLLGQLAVGVRHAHAARVVHRDLKPDNVLVDRGGDLRILDFGLAKDLNLPIAESLDRIVGTPLYMAPELLRMILGLEAFEAERSSSPKLDVYAAALTGIEMLVGHNPLAPVGSYGQLLTAKLDAARRFAPLLRRVGAPRPWRDALLAGIVGDPAARPAIFGPDEGPDAVPGAPPSAARPAAAMLAAALVAAASLGLAVSMTPWFLLGLAAAATIGFARPRAPAADRERTRSAAARPAAALSPEDADRGAALSSRRPMLVVAREQYHVGAATLAIVLGKLTDVAADAWFVAEDSQLGAPGPIAQAVRRRAGDVPPAVRARLPLPLGAVVATPGEAAGTRHVLHAVMVDAAGGERRLPPDAGVFRTCVAAALRTAADLGATSLAMPLVAAGCGTLPVDDVARAVLGPLVELLVAGGAGPLRRVVLVAATDDDALLTAVRDQLVERLPRGATVASGGST